MKKIMLMGIVGICSVLGAMDHNVPLDEQQQQQGSLVTLVFDTQPPQRLTLSRALAEESMTLKNILTDLPAQGEIPVAGEHAAGIAWLDRNHANMDDKEKCLALLNRLHNEDLSNVTHAAHYLEISSVAEAGLGVIGTRLLEDNLKDQFLMSKHPEAYRPSGIHESLLKLALHQKKPLHDLLDELKAKGRKNDTKNESWIAFADDYSIGVVSMMGETYVSERNAFGDYQGKKLLSGTIDAAAFDRDNKEIFVGNAQGITVFKRDPSTDSWQWTQKLQDGAAITSITQFSPNRVVTGSDRRILKSFKNIDGRWSYEQTLSGRHQRGLAHDGNVIAYITTDNHIEMLRHDPTTDMFVQEGDIFVDQTPFVGVAFDVTRNIVCVLDERGHVAFCKQDAPGSWQMKDVAPIGQSEEKYNSLYITRDGSMMVAGSDKRTRLFRHGLHEHDGRITLHVREFAELDGTNSVLNANGTVIYDGKRAYVVESSDIERLHFSFEQLYLLMLADAQKRAIDIADYPNLKSLYDSFSPLVRSHAAHWVCESKVVNLVNTEPDNKLDEVNAKPDNKLEVVSAKPDNKLEVVSAKPDNKLEVVSAKPDNKLEVVSAEPDKKLKQMFTSLFGSAKK